MALRDGGGKLPGKAEYSGRRRATTRKSGFKSHENSTGGEFRQEQVDAFMLPKEKCITLTFSIPKHRVGQFVGFGGWLSLDGIVEVTIDGGPKKRTEKFFTYPSWSKFGSMWQSTDGLSIQVAVSITAKSNARFAIFEPMCGVIHHEHIAQVLENEDADRAKRLLKNMYTFSPEAHFIANEGNVAFTPDIETLGESVAKHLLTLKSCNRCARFLPINLGGENERNHLSFSNHCVASHRRPCRHGGFGILKDDTTGEKLYLDYGFQLECRFCKKFEVNAAHNPQRTSAQMKEDAARRRGFELLMERLFEGSPQLRYRLRTSRELANDVYKKFGQRCFKCNATLKSVNEMNLDHTRPLALLWPLDETATALCKSCNSEKRDRPPSLFYDGEEIERLSHITGLSTDELLDPSPNTEVLDAMADNLDWFFDTFLTSDEMTKERDGKITGELIVKALHKVDAKRIGGAKLDLLNNYSRRRAN